MNGLTVYEGSTNQASPACVPTRLRAHPSAGQELPKLKVEAIRGMQGIKEATLRLPDTSAGGMAGRELRVAVASGIGAARHLLERMHTGEGPAYDFVEVRGRGSSAGLGSTGSAVQPCRQCN